mmetsp:Transcript_8917/g.20032  ORF Transcript_8917/g.20032 Transcript_8917/m.20032 type:complete len:144 (-) Transcript_8917:681-1112(-)
MLFGSNDESRLKEEDCFNECKHRAKKEMVDTPMRIMRESGTDRNRGRGYPLENRRMRVRILKSACGESGRRALEEFVFDVDVATVVELSSSLFASTEVGLGGSIFSTKKSAYRLPSLPHSLSAKKTAVQSESRTRSAFRPRQY